MILCFIIMFKLIVLYIVKPLKMLKYNINAVILQLHSIY